MITEGLQAVTIEFLPMSMAEALHSLIFTGLLHQTVTGEAEKEEEVMGLHGDHGVLNQVAGDLLHLGAPHTAGHPGLGVADLELQVVTGAAIKLLKIVKSEEINKLKGLCHIFCQSFVYHPGPEKSIICFRSNSVELSFQYYCQLFVQ